MPRKAPPSLDLVEWVLPDTRANQDFLAALRETDRVIPSLGWSWTGPVRNWSLYGQAVATFSEIESRVGRKVSPVRYELANDIYRRLGDRLEDLWGITVRGPMSRTAAYNTPRLQSDSDTSKSETRVPSLAKQLGGVTSAGLGRSEGRTINRRIATAMHRGSRPVKLSVKLADPVTVLVPQPSVLTIAEIGLAARGSEIDQERLARAIKIGATRSFQSMAFGAEVVEQSVRTFELNPLAKMRSRVTGNAYRVVEDLIVDPGRACDLLQGMVSEEELYDLACKLYEGVYKPQAYSLNWKLIPEFYRERRLAQA